MVFRSSMATLLASVACVSAGMAAAEETVTVPAAVTVEMQAVAALWANVKAGCPESGTARLLVDNAGFGKGNGSVPEAARSLVQTKLDAAYDALFATDTTGWRREIPPADRDTLRRYAAGEAFGPNGTVDKYRDTYLFATADIVPTSDGKYVLSLTARGFPTRDKLSGCSAQSGLFEMPEEQLGDPVERLDAIFDRTAREMMQAAKTGKMTLVALSAEVTGEGAAPKRWTESFVDEANLAVGTAIEAATTRSVGGTARLRVQPADDTTVPEGQDVERWPSRVKIERRHNAYRVFVAVEPPGAQGIYEKGLVTAEALPAVPVDQLQDASGIGGGKLLTLDEEPREIEAALAHGTDVHEYAFWRDEGGVVEFKVDPTTEADPPVVALYGGDKALIAPNLSSPTPDIQRYRLEPGIYRLRIQNATKGPLGYTMRARAATHALLPLLRNGQRIVHLYGDWQVGEAVDGDRRACFARSLATRWAPEGWRPIQPYLWFLAEADPVPGDRMLIEQTFDRPSYYDLGQPLYAAVFGSKAKWQIPIGAFGEQIQSRETRDVMSVPSLEGMTQGRTLVIEGTTKDGRLAHVEYSLVGYQAAMNHILTACGRTELRRALIRR